LSKKNLTPLWELRFKACPSSYAFGTVHVQDKRAFTFAAQAVECLKTCQSFYSEIEFDPHAMALFAQAQNLKNGQSLRDHLSPKRYEKYKLLIKKKFGLNLEQMDRLLPIILLNHLTLSFIGSENEMQLDAYLAEQATKYGLQTKGLESYEEHLGVLKNISLKLQLKQLNDFLRMSAKYRKKTLQMLDLYAAGDIYRLYKMAKGSLGKLKRPMLYDRNELMANRIFENRQRPCFYAFGAGHLSGQQGVIRKLKNKGYQLQPIPVSAVV